MNNQNQNRFIEQFYESLRDCGYNVATNYRQRARKILEQLLWGIKAFVGVERWREVSPETMESLIDELPGILNRFLKGTGIEYSGWPLTEEQMTEIEQNMASQKSTIIKTDDFIAITLEPIDNSTSNKGGA